MEKFYQEYKNRAADMGSAISREMGCPIDKANRDQVGAGIWHTKGLMSALQEFEFERPFSADAPNDRIIYEPIGVCALISRTLLFFRSKSAPDPTRNLTISMRP